MTLEIDKCARIFFARAGSGKTLHEHPDALGGMVKSFIGSATIFTRQRQTTTTLFFVDEKQKKLTQSGHFLVANVQCVA